MSSAGVGVILFQDSLASPTVATDDPFEQSLVMRHDRFGAGTAASEAASRGRRRTPRKSLIVVLPDNHVVSPDRLTERLAADGDNEDVDVILACAGQPVGIALLQRQVRDLQVLLAPAGTSPEDLRELAMEQAPGDIVTLVSGTPSRRDDW